MRRSGPPKRKTPMPRSGRVKPVNRERRDEKHARNFGAEAERVRAMPCLCSPTLGRLAAARLDWSTTGPASMLCCGIVAAAHVTARGMGASKGGRVDLVPLCHVHHEEAGEARSPFRAAFEQRYGLDLRAEADRIALEHPRPLGIRGLADRWAQWRYYWTVRQAHESGDGPQPNAPEVAPLDAYETAALLGWVRREIAREVERRTASHRRAWSFASQLGLPIEWDANAGLVALVQREQRGRGERPWDGRDDDDHDALADHIVAVLGLSSDVARLLCEAGRT